MNQPESNAVSRAKSARISTSKAWLFTCMHILAHQMPQSLVKRNKGALPAVFRH